MALRVRADDGSPLTHYTRSQVATRIGQVLGTKPSRYQMARAEVRESLEPRLGRMRPTAGMPAPDVRSPDPLWRVDQIEEWLAHHPALEVDRVKADLARDCRLPGADRRALVLAAKEWGLSWAQIAEVLGEVEERPLTRQAVALRYQT